jgi:hypothetical protein
MQLPARKQELHLPAGKTRDWPKFRPSTQVLLPFHGQGMARDILLKAIFVYMVSKLLSSTLKREVHPGKMHDQPKGQFGPYFGPYFDRLGETVRRNFYYNDLSVWTDSSLEIFGTRDF